MRKCITTDEAWTILGRMGYYPNPLEEYVPPNNELDEHGKLVYKHKTNKRLFLERAYRWKDNVVLIDETEGRQHIMSFKYSDFDFSAWEPMTKEEYDLIKSCYKECYER